MYLLRINFMRVKAIFKSDWINFIVFLDYVQVQEYKNKKKKYVPINKRKEMLQ